VSESILTARLRYSEHGWPTFLLEPRSKKPLGATAPNGSHSATLDPERINHECARWPDANIAITTGPTSGLVVIAPDGPTGHATLLVHQRKHGPLPMTLWARSGREDGGWHGYFKWPAEGFGNVTGAIIGANRHPCLGADIDARGSGGYVVAPPSIHPSGRRYVWVNWGTPVAPLPQWLLEMRQRSARPQSDLSTPPTIRHLSRYVQTALNGERDNVANAPRGARNRTLYAAAVKLGKHVGHGRVTRPTVQAVLYYAAEKCGLNRDDGPRATLRTIDSGIEDGLDIARRELGASTGAVA
jgi:hypothetical protein